MNYKTVLEFIPHKKLDKTVKLFFGPFSDFGFAVSKAYRLADNSDMVSVAVISQENELCFLISKDKMPHIYNLPDCDYDDTRTTL